MTDQMQTGSRAKAGHLSAQSGDGCWRHLDPDCQLCDECGHLEHLDVFDLQPVQRHDALRQTTCYGHLICQTCAPDKYLEAAKP